MPKLGRYAAILDAVVFLYENKDDAKRGEQIGGTGFLISVPSKRFPDHVRHAHAVTNWHVAVCGAPSCPVIRLNFNTGGTDIVEFDPSEWAFKSSGPDVAISPPLTISPLHKAIPIDVGFLLSSKTEAKHEIGPGDDAFMVGRFVDFDGEETNAPAVRFGHISIMHANIEQDTGYKGRSIVIDMHSRTGFSGSPVFVYRTIGSYFFDAEPGKVLTGGGHYIELLGIHWAQFPEEWELTKEQTPRRAARNASLVKGSESIQGLSGMTCVVPAADILALLDSPELEAMREANENKQMDAIKRALRRPKAESSKGPKDVPDANPNHLEDFNRLADVAARKRPQGDQS